MAEEGCFSSEEEGEPLEGVLRREEQEEEDRYDLEEVEDETLVRRLLGLEEVLHDLVVEVCPWCQYVLVLEELVYHLTRNLLNPSKLVEEEVLMDHHLLALEEEVHHVLVEVVSMDHRLLALEEVVQHVLERDVEDQALECGLEEERQHELVLVHLAKEVKVLHLGTYLHRRHHGHHRHRYLFRLLTQEKNDHWFVPF